MNKKDDNPYVLISWDIGPALDDKGNNVIALLPKFYPPGSNETVSAPTFVLSEEAASKLAEHLLGQVEILRSMNANNLNPH